MHPLGAWRLGHGLNLTVAQALVGLIKAVRSLCVCVPRAKPPSGTNAAHWIGVVVGLILGGISGGCPPLFWAQGLGPGGVERSVSSRARKQIHARHAVVAAVPDRITVLDAVFAHHTFIGLKIHSVG